MKTTDDEDQNQEIERQRLAEELHSKLTRNLFLYGLSLEELRKFKRFLEELRED